MAFDDDFEDLVEDFAEAFGQLVTVKRSGLTTAGVTAQPWDREYETVAPNGLPTVIVARDWLILASEYKVDAEAVTPRSGDQLIDTSGRIWEVLPIAGRPAYEQHGDSWLVRTKQVAE